MGYLSCRADGLQLKDGVTTDCSYRYGHTVARGESLLLDHQGAILKTRAELVKCSMREAWAPDDEVDRGPARRQHPTV